MPLKKSKNHENAARSKAPPKRAASIRSGFKYQDYMAAESALRMMIGDDGPLCIELENRRGGTFDDLVEYYPDRTVWQQIK